MYTNRNTPYQLLGFARGLRGFSGARLLARFNALVAAPPRCGLCITPDFPSQPIALTLFNLFNLKNSLPNQLISRACTVLHVTKNFSQRLGSCPFRLILHSALSTLHLEGRLRGSWDRSVRFKSRSQHFNTFLQHIFPRERFASRNPRLSCFPIKDDHDKPGVSTHQLAPATNTFLPATV
jgi:hypothetical protein